MTDRTSAIEVGRRTTELSLAVWPVDGYTGGRPLGTLRVGVDGLDVEPIRNPSGYHLFLDVTVGDEPVITVDDDQDRYLPFREKVSLIGVEPPAVPITLVPAPAYPFPGVTLARGVVWDAPEVPLEGASVSATGTERSTRTDAKGEFALSLEDLDIETVKTVDPETNLTTINRFLEADGQNPEITVVRPDGDPTVPSDVRTATKRVPFGDVWTIEIRYY